MASDPNATRATVVLFLSPMAMDCQLLIDDVDVSKHVRGVEVWATVGELTEVRVTLLANVQVMGDVGRLTFVKQEP